MFRAYAATRHRHSAMLHSQLMSATDLIENRYDLDVIQIETNDMDHLRCIAEMSLHLQRNLDELNFFWTSAEAKTVCMFMWAPYNMHNIDRIGHDLTVRGDEIIFPTIDTRENVSWAVGHPRALLNWGLTLPYAGTVADPYPRQPRIRLAGGELSNTARLIWWAQRINLRVYSAA